MFFSLTIAKKSCDIDKLLNQSIMSGGTAGETWDI